MLLICCCTGDQWTARWSVFVGPLAGCWTCQCHMVCGRISHFLFLVRLL